jgi:hypothetical protein
MLLGLSTILSCSSPEQGGPELTPRIAPGLHLVEDLRLDGHREDFSNIVDDMVLGPNGQVAVFDAWRFQLIFYDSTGRQLGTFGRQGEGPGEFKVSGTTRAGAKASVNVGTVGDTIWTWDHAMRRLSYVSWDRTLLGTVRLNPRSFAQSLRSESPEGFRLTALCGDSGYLALATFRTGQQRETRVVHLSPAMAEVRTIASAPRQSRLRVEVASPHAPSAVVNSVLHDVVWRSDVAQGRCEALVVHANMRSPDPVTRITTIGPTGDTLRSIAVPAQRARVDREQAARVYRQEYAGMRRARLSDSTPVYDVASLDAAERAMIDAIPEWVPDVTHITAGTDGTFALSRPAEGDSVAMVLYRADATERGTVRIRYFNGRVLRLTHDHLWRTEYDADGVVSVVRYRIVER